MRRILSFFKDRRLRPYFITGLSAISLGLLFLLLLSPVMWKIYPASIQAVLAFDKLGESAYNEPICHEDCFLKREFYKKIIRTAIPNEKIAAKVEEAILDENNNDNFRLELLDVFKNDNGDNIATEFINNYLKDPDGNLRIKQAILEKFNLNYPPLVKDLMAKVNNYTLSEPERQEALVLLERTHYDSLVDFYLETLSKDPSLKIRDEAITALSNINNAEYFGKTQLAQLKKLLLDKDLDNRLKRSLVLLLADLRANFGLEFNNILLSVYSDPSNDKFVKYFSAEILNKLSASNYSLPQISQAEWDTYLSQQINFNVASDAQMPAGTLLYRTVANNLAYGYNTQDLIAVDNKKLSNLYTGHAGLYIGQTDGVDYVLEALPSGVVKTPLKYFVNSSAGEKLIGTKIPKSLNSQRVLRVMELARVLANSNLAYDFDFATQKGPGSGQWTCVGLLEKIYESADLINPRNLKGLVYNSDEYAIDITPDGYDSSSLYNKKTNDYFSKTYEFSKISRKTNVWLPAPEIVGYDAGLIYKGSRYFFIPYTQYLQATLKNVKTNAELSSNFIDENLRGKVPQISLLLKWSLVNNPLSALQELASKVAQAIGVSDNPNVLLTGNDNQAITIDAVATANTVSAKTSAVKTSPPKKSSTTKTASVAPVKNTLVTAKNLLSSEIVKTVSNLKPATVASKLVTAATRAVSSTVAKALTTTPVITPVTPVTNNYTTVVNNQTETASLKKIWIDKIYTGGDNDFIVLYNPNNEAIDLATANIRLEKTKTASDPSIMIRLGNLEDGDYPEGTEIPALGTYLIAKAGASVEITARAQAIAKNSAFSLGSANYTVFLGNNAISSYDDPDIFDAVGFGVESAYFSGASPAMEIPDDQILARKITANSSFQSMSAGGSEYNLNTRYNSQNNGQDFLLISDPSLVPIKSVENNATNNDNQNQNNNSNSNETVATSSLQNLVISALYTTKENDFIEIYNPNESAIDLSLGNYRLEKVKTASDPSILIRFGNADDGQYPGGNIINPHDYYLVARNEANTEIKSMAQAIATGTNFTFAGSGYTIFLATGPVTSASDSDIVDKVGFGPDALYFEGSAPAPEILDNHLLVRKVSQNSDKQTLSPGGSEADLGRAYDSDNNQNDFVLLDYGFESEDTSSASSGFLSSGLTHLWHFDECRGSALEDSKGSLDLNLASHWRSGKFGCALEEFYQYVPFKVNFPEPLAVGNLTFSFYYKNVQADNGRIAFKLINSSDDSSAGVAIDTGYTWSFGLPGEMRDYNLRWPADDSWHLVTWVINSSNDYWELYLDGSRIYRGEFQAIFKKNFDVLQIAQENNYSYIDEVALWNKALSAEEILEMVTSDKQLEPVSSAVVSKPLELRNYWSFDERTGTQAVDSIGQSVLNFPESYWLKNGQVNGAIWQDYLSNKRMGADIKPFKSQDVSLEFWWQNIAYSDGGRLEVKLMSQGNTFLGLIPDYFRVGAYFNNNYYMLSQGVGDLIPADANWHHVVLVYDSTLMKLSLYVDGVPRWAATETWLPEEFYDRIEINNQAFSSGIDELKIWQGALSAEEVLQNYQQGLN